MKTKSHLRPAERCFSANIDYMSTKDKEIKCKNCDVINETGYCTVAGGRVGTKSVCKYFSKQMMFRFEEEDE